MKNLFLRPKDRSQPKPMWVNKDTKMKVFLTGAIIKIAKGEMVQVIRKALKGSEVYCFVVYNNRNGWIAAADLDFEPPAAAEPEVTAEEA